MPASRPKIVNRVPTAFQARQPEFIFSADEMLDEKILSESDLSAKYEGVASKFAAARTAALDNTRYYLSMPGDLDVSVATSMRTRQDFRGMNTLATLRILSIPVVRVICPTWKE